MNITILANRDLASHLALNRLIPALAKKHQLQLFLSSHVGGSAAVPAELEQLTFFEQPLFNFDQLALTTDTPLAELNKINSEAGLVSLAATEPDLVLSIRYGGILRDAAIAIPRLGVLNLHSGLLPDYRGVMATFYAMLNGETEVGMTLHTIVDAGIDTGNIIGNTRHKLDLEHSYLWNVLQLYPAGVYLMLDAVEQLFTGATLSHHPQSGGGNYYSFPSEEQLRDFGDRGFCLYDVEEIILTAK